jgi:hypothetical protein
LICSIELTTLIVIPFKNVGVGKVEDVFIPQAQKCNFRLYLLEKG